MVEVIKKKLNMDFDAAVEHVKAVVGEKFSIFLVKPVTEVIKKKFGLTDADFAKKATTILACNAKLAKMALDVTLDNVNFMPCSFVVSEEDGQVYLMHVSIMKAMVETGIADAEAMKPVLEATSKEVTAVIDKILATQK